MADLTSSELTELQRRFQPSEPPAHVQTAIELQLDRIRTCTVLVVKDLPPGPEVGNFVTCMEQARFWMEKSLERRSE